MKASSEEISSVLFIFCCSLVLTSKQIEFRDVIHFHTRIIDNKLTAICCPVTLSAKTLHWITSKDNIRQQKAFSCLFLSHKGQESSSDAQKVGLLAETMAKAGWSFTQAKPPRQSGPQNKRSYSTSASSRSEGS